MQLEWGLSIPVDQASDLVHAIAWPFHKIQAHRRRSLPGDTDPLAEQHVSTQGVKPPLLLTKAELASHQTYTALVRKMLDPIPDRVLKGSNRNHRFYNPHA